MNSNWDLLMNEIRTFEKREYRFEKTCFFLIYNNKAYHNCKLYDRSIISYYLFGGYTHKDKKELLKMNKIKGYSKCNNHRQLNKLMMSF
jgi:hypothetical protein